MRRATRGRIVSGALLGCVLVAAAAVAQDAPADTMNLLREKARTDKKVVVASVLDLTEREASAFWPVYNAYQSDMIAHYDHVLKFIDAFAKSYNAMTDETASKLVNDYLALERAHVTLLSTYVPRFQTVLPPKKVAKLYQIENKMRALVNYEMAKQIPMLK